MIADTSQLFILSAAIIIALLYKARQSRSASSTLPLPPSPPGYPILGNLFDVVAPGNAVRHYSNLAKKHGEDAFMQPGPTVPFIKQPQAIYFS